MAQASVAESSVALPPVKGAHHDHSQNPPEPFRLLVPASAGSTPGGATEDPEARADPLAKADEYDLLAACNREWETRLPTKARSHASHA